MLMLIDRCLLDQIVEMRGALHQILYENLYSCSDACIEMSTAYHKLDLSKHQLDGAGGANSNWQTLAPNFRGKPIYAAQFCLLILTHLLGERSTENILVGGLPTTTDSQVAGAMMCY